MRGGKRDRGVSSGTTGSSKAGSGTEDLEQSQEMFGWWMTDGEPFKGLTRTLTYNVVGIEGAQCDDLIHIYCEMRTRVRLVNTSISQLPSHSRVLTERVSVLREAIKAKHKRPHVARFHLHEMPRNGKSIETESRLAVVGG